MDEFLIQHAAELFDVGVVGVLLGVLILGLWLAFRAVGKALLPSAQAWMRSHSQLADTCREELPKMREVMENSTSAVKECTAMCKTTSEMAKQALENTAVVGREQRLFRDGTVQRDEKIIQKLDGLEKLLTDKGQEQA